MHPTQLGITKEIEFSVSPTREMSPVEIMEGARIKGHFLYVAWLPDKARALKIGLTRKSLHSRWAPIIRMLRRPIEKLLSLRPHEMVARERLLGFSAGGKVEVFLSPFPPRPDTKLAALVQSMSLEEAERVLDEGFAPVFGRMLGPRSPWV